MISKMEVAKKALIQIAVLKNILFLGSTTSFKTLTLCVLQDHITCNKHLYYGMSVRSGQLTLGTTSIGQCMVL